MRPCASALYADTGPFFDLIAANQFNSSQDGGGVASAMKVDGGGTGYGANIVGLAPCASGLLLDQNGQKNLADGTSFAAPYVAGLFAAGCQAAGTLCNTMANASVAYQALKDQAVKGSIVTDAGSASLPSATPSRFFVRNGW